jgi:hypothetical protein
MDPNTPAPTIAISMDNHLTKFQGRTFYQTLENNKEQKWDSMNCGLST